jgi:site-specific DNA recombinase
MQRPSGRHSHLTKIVFGSLVFPQVSVLHYGKFAPPKVALYASLMTVPKTRAVGLIRLSKSPDPASTSVARQQAIIEAYADQQNIIISGWAIDTAVSAFRIPPEKRKQVKEWLARHEEYDCWLYWRQDRIVRQTQDFMGLVGWCKAHGKKMYSATEGLGDVTQRIGELMGFITAWQSQGESEATSARVKLSQERLAQEGRWRGGRPAHWQRSICVCHQLEKCPEYQECRGWKLVINEDRAPTIREAVRRVTAGESVNAVVTDLNRRGILSTDGKLWSATSMRNILRNRNLMDGGLLTGNEYGQLQAALKERSINRTVRTVDRDCLTLDLVFCGACGGKIYRWRRFTGRYSVYGRCRNEIHREGPECGLKPIPYDFLIQAVTQDVEAHRDGVIETRVTNAARTRRLDDIDQELFSLTADFTAGRVARPEFAAKQNALLDEGDVLRADAGGPRWHTTGETVGERWDRLSDAERRLWLLRIGTTYTVTRTQDGAWELASSWHEDDDSEFRERIVRAATQPLGLAG